MKLLTLNVNGIRAFYGRNALTSLIEDNTPDVICLQETKATDSYVKDTLTQKLPDYNTFTNSSKTVNGYAGVSVSIKNTLNVVSHQSIDLAIDERYSSGRILMIELDDFIIVNVYTLNSGSKDELRKSWDKSFKELISSLSTYDKPLVIAGDFNVCHGKLDHYSWSRSLGTGPSLMQFEIDGFNSLLELGLTDAYRHLNPVKSSYTWFSYYGNSRKFNRGYRIDYILVSDSIKDKVETCKNLSDLNISDHCPVIAEIIL